MSHLFFYVLSALLFLPLPGEAQLRWDGGGGDGEWNNALNWSNDQLPSLNDGIILDNSVLPGSYVVSLPAGLTTVSIKTLSIQPVGGNHIELILPESNTIVPALMINGPGYGMWLHAGAIFRNASGASSGTPVSVSDSIRIDNGARYIHHSERAHAENVAVLSRSPGTENGTMEFSSPSVSSTLSMSGRNFGNLVLTAEGTEGELVKYTAAGTNGLIIRGDLSIGAGVTLGFNFSDTISIHGSLLHDGILDLGNTARSVVMTIAKNITESSSAFILESGGADQEILLNGTQGQFIDMRGSMQGHIGFKLQSAGDVTLEVPLRISHRLSLVHGILRTSDAALLTMSTDSKMFCDTIAALSYIDGPVRVEGLANSLFTFPVGIGKHMRWVQLQEATGNFLVEYILSDPHVLTAEIGSGLDHISQIEYWKISADGAAPGFSVKTSFLDPGSGGVTSLADLRVARLVGNRWENAGNMSTGGSAGSQGWVSSFRVSGFSATDQCVALASVNGQENPLPFMRIGLTGKSGRELLHLKWDIDTDEPVQSMQVECGSIRSGFRVIKTFAYRSDQRTYQFDTVISTDGISACRIKATDNKNDRFWLSNIMPVRPGGDNELLSLSKLVCVSGNLSMAISSDETGFATMRLFSVNGEQICNWRRSVGQGASTIELHVPVQCAGWYVFQIVMPGGRKVAQKFFATGR